MLLLCSTWGAPTLNEQLLIHPTTLTHSRTYTALELHSIALILGSLSSLLENSHPHH